MLLFLSFCLSVDKPVLVVLPFLLRDLLPPLLPPGPLLLTTLDLPLLVFVLLPILLFVEAFTALKSCPFSFLTGGLDDNEDDEGEEGRTEETEEVEESADEVATVNPSLLLCFTSTFSTDTSLLPLLLLLLP